MTAKRFTLGLLLGTAVMLALAAAFNRLVDPFWYFRDIEIEGFNVAKPKFARFERHIKPQLLAREQPQAIVLGSSFSEIGFDANDPALSNGGALRTYNFAFAGADWALVQCHFDYALSATRLERVVIGIHPGSLPAVRDCARRMPEVSGFFKAKLLLSLQVLKHSVRTVREQGTSRSSHTREGRYLYTRDAPGVDARFREFFLQREYVDPNCTRERLPAAAPASRDIGPAEIVPAKGLDLSGLRSVIRQARAHGVELRLLAYPKHALSLELDLLCDQDAARWRALAAVAQAVAEESPDGGTQLWAFYAYNEITGEPIAGRKPVYWQDPEHFNYEMGSLMLADMFAPTGRGRIGYRVTPENVVESYRAFLAGRDSYLRAHPGFYEELRASLVPLR